MSPTRCPSTAFLTTAALTLAFGASAVFAQSALETPAPSPKARAEQRVGITDFAIDYSSPGVKGRPIWGALVPYNQLWRTGANSATKLTASRDFSFGGKAVPAGSYSIFTIPTSSSWTMPGWACGEMVHSYRLDRAEIGSICTNSGARSPPVSP